VELFSDETGFQQGLHRRFGYFPKQTNPYFDKVLVARKHWKGARLVTSDIMYHIPTKAQIDGLEIAGQVPGALRMAVAGQGDKGDGHMNAEAYMKWWRDPSGAMHCVNNLLSEIQRVEGGARRGML